MTVRQVSAAPFYVLSVGLCQVVPFAVITYGLQATTTAAATTTPESNDLIGSMGKNNRAVGAERILVELLEVVCQTTTGNFQI